MRVCVCTVYLCETYLPDTVKRYNDTHTLCNTFYLNKHEAIYVVVLPVSHSLTSVFAFSSIRFCSLWHHASRTILATHIHTNGLALPNTLFAVYCQITYKHNIFSIKQIPMFINHPFIHPSIRPPTLLLLLLLPCRHIQFHCAPVHIFHWLTVLPYCCCFFSSLNFAVFRFSRLSCSWMLTLLVCVRFAADCVHILCIHRRNTRKYTHTRRTPMKTTTTNISFTFSIYNYISVFVCTSNDCVTPRRTRESRMQTLFTITKSTQKTFRRSNMRECICGKRNDLGRCNVNTVPTSQQTIRIIDAWRW